jgi:serine/threonine protein kinase
MDVDCNETKHIVRIIEGGLHAQVAVFNMVPTNCGKLSDYRKSNGGYFPEAKAREILKQVLDAIDEAKDMGLIGLPSIEEIMVQCD